MREDDGMTEERVETCLTKDEAMRVVSEIAESFARMGLGKSHGVRRIKRGGAWWVMVTRDKEEA